MNKPAKLCVIVAVLLLAAVCFAGTAAAEELNAEDNSVTVDELYTFPLMPETEQEELQSVYDTGLLMAGEYTILPEKYDLRDYGYVTSVRNQDSYGVCWSFGIAGAMESSILKNGLVTGTDAENLDLSELHMIYYLINRDGVTKTTYLEPFIENGDSYAYASLWYNADGTYDKEHMYYGNDAIYQVMSGIGTADEDTNPALKYEMMDYYFVDGNKLEPETAVDNSYYPENTINIKSTDTSAIKECIMEYGAGMINYYAGSVRTFNGHVVDGNIVFDNWTSSSSYQNEHKTKNHAVTLIGWDDNYPKENFGNYQIASVTEEGEYICKEIPRPTSNGAWLIKNSWGEHPEIEYYGYTWLSYEDPSVGNVVFYDMTKANSFYDTIYQYDLGLETATLGNSGDDVTEVQEIATKNVFEAKSHEKITAVLFTTKNTNIRYSIDILVNGSSVLTEPITGYLTYVGEYTILLPETENVEVKAGDKIEVIVEQSMSTPPSETKLVAAFDCWRLTNDTTAGSEVSSLSFVTTGISGRSYIKCQNDDTWTDIATLPEVTEDVGTNHTETKYGYARIKLYTVDVIEKNVDSTGTADFSGDNVQVQKIRFTDAAPGTTVTYVDKLLESEKPEEDNYQVIGGFSVEVGEGYQEGTKAAVTFTADSAYPAGVKLMHRVSSGDWETLTTTYAGNDEYTAETTSFSPFAIVQYAKPATTSSSVTAFFGTKDGSDFTFKRAVVITKATLPGATYATVTNTSGSGWYTCKLSADGFTGEGILYFQVPLDVIDIKGWTVNDVSLLGCRTTYLSSDNQYAYYSAIITNGGALTIDFEKDAAQKVVETKPVTETKTVETPVTTTPVTTEKPVTTETTPVAKSPFPVLGILAGLGIAGVLVMRRH